MLTSKLRTRALGAVALAASGAVFAAIGLADPGSGPNLQHVPTANEKAAGYAPASRLSVELQRVVWAQGADLLENPKDIITNYGYENDVPSSNPKFPQMVPFGPAAPQNSTEAQKTEPDKNTYLEFKRGLRGADANYDYGTHFLYQGHELAANVPNGSGTGTSKRGYITRINLDADAAHRVTRLASEDNKGNPIDVIDGSTWEPFAQRLLFTTEGTTRPTYAATADYPSTVEDVSGALGRGGYEGIQDDSDGNVWIVEDIGGAPKAGTTAAKQPNSFVYRYVPRRPGDLHNGKLQALQVSNESGSPITFASQQPLNAPDQKLDHSYGQSLDTRWVTVHDTATEGETPFNANERAKAAQATPFKRPENGLFRPGSKFREFYFDETGDTNANGEENNTAGGWGAVQKLVQRSPSADTGKLSLFYYGDKEHSGFDNNAWLSRDEITFVEDAGDTLHTQRNALDSGFVLDADREYSKPANQPVRWLAQGRDPSATIDSGRSFPGEGTGSKNDGDNEISGLHVSDGDQTVRGILGAKAPKLFQDGWRWFYSDQHGDNRTFEVIPSAPLDQGSYRNGGEDENDRGGR